MRNLMDILCDDKPTLHRQSKQTFHGHHSQGVFCRRRKNPLIQSWKSFLKLEILQQSKSEIQTESRKLFTLFEFTLSLWKHMLLSS